MNRHFADVFETVARAVPERPVVVSGGSELTWRDFDARSNGVANDLVGAGIARQGKVTRRCSTRSVASCR